MKGLGGEWGCPGLDQGGGCSSRGGSPGPCLHWDGAAATTTATTIAALAQLLTHRGQRGIHTRHRGHGSGDGSIRPLSGGHAGILEAIVGGGSPGPPILTRPTPSPTQARRPTPKLCIHWGTPRGSCRQSRRHWGCTGRGGQQGRRGCNNSSQTAGGGGGCSVSKGQREGDGNLPSLRDTGQGFPPALIRGEWGWGGHRGGEYHVGLLTPRGEGGSQAIPSPPQFLHILHGHGG